jgi:hypothetical protein
MALFTLRFDNYAQAKAAATQLGFWDLEEDQLKTGGQSTREDGTVYGWAIDEIGLDPVITPGEYDEEGNEVTPPVRLDGYFVNVTGELPEPALAFLAPGGYGCAGRLFAGTVAGAHEGALPDEPQPPPHQGTVPNELAEHDGETWLWDRRRWPDGTFMDDILITPENEAYEWVMV